MQNETSFNIDNLTQAELETLLGMMLSPDTTAIKQATEVLKKYFKKPVAVEFLLTVASQHTETSYRQISAVLLRKMIGKVWLNITTDNQG
jgi:hypothetical protein